jgi:hypothetical protein
MAKPASKHLDTRKADIGDEDGMADMAMHLSIQVGKLNAVLRDMWRDEQHRRYDEGLLLALTVAVAETAGWLSRIAEDIATITDGHVMFGHAVEVISEVWRGRHAGLGASRYDILDDLLSHFTIQEKGAL